jgi:acyl-coenzyme A synthetase/AMP-(fatty) acid ligase/NRPS condensation-like uncharacterized protein
VEKSSSRYSQEEEWAGPVLSSMPKTLQLAVRRFRGASRLNLAPVRANTVVGVYMERSELLIRVVFGVMESGAAFVPLDSQYGLEVVEFRLRDANSALLVVRWFVAVRGAPLCLAGELSEAQCRVTLSACSDLAYVMHTSGSSGAPKGAMVLQRNVMNLLAWSAFGEHHTLCREDVFVWQSSISFDMLILDLLWPASVECGILAVRDERNSDGFAHAMQESNAAVLFIVPSHLSVLLGSVWCKSLELVIAGGEGLSQKLSESTESRGVQLLNFYGPTECTVGISSHLVKRERESEGLVPIGRAFPNAKLVIHGIERGVFVCGASVGKGYVNRSDLTRRVFVCDFWRNDGAAVAYNTLDKARWSGEGEAMYEGRLDDQVKISGQRVELGAVENAVLACAGVQQCAVVVVEASGAMKSLAAVFVGSASEGEVKSELARRVARHEVPSVVVRVEGIPLTTAGKADRRAVRAMVAGRGAGGAAATGAARREEKTGGEEEATSVESVVREAFGEVLGRMKVDGWKGSFWELGGTSLMAMALDAALQRKTGVKVGIGRLMRDGSVAGIAETIKGEWRETAMGGAARLLEERAAEKQQERQQQQETRSPLFWASASQAGLYVAWKMEESPKNAYTVSQVFEAEERLDEGRLARAVAGLRRVHETLRTRFCEADGRVMQVVEAEEASGGGAGLEVVEAEDRVEQELVARELARHAFDLRQGPLLRVVLVRCAPAAAAAAAAESCKDVLVFVMPHICYDHGSEKRLFGDLVKLYKEEKTAKELRGTSMREFVAWEERVLAERGPVLEAYWKRALGGAKLNRIPGTKSCGAREEAARVESIRWKAEAGERVRGWMRKHGWHQVSVLHATMAALIARLSGDESVVLAIALSQRGGVASGDEVVGYLMNTVWVRYEVRMEQMGLVEYVDECQRRISEAFEHGEYPLALVWRAAGFGEMGAGDEVTVALDVVPRFPAEEVSGLLRESGIERPQLPPQMIQFSGELEGATTAGLAVNARAGNFSESSCGAWSLLAKWNSLLLAWMSDVGCSVGSSPGQEVVWFEGEAAHKCVSLDALMPKNGSICTNLFKIGSGLAGVRMEQSVLLVGVVFGIVQGGGSFLICEKDLSWAAVASRLEDVTVCVVDQLWVGAGIRQVRASGLQKCGAVPVFCSRWNDCAYVMYTSGTTGQAKGVRVGRRNLENYLSWHALEAFSSGHGEVAVLCGTLSFDGNLTVLFWPAMCCGGKVMTLSRKRLQDLDGVVNAVANAGNCFLKLVPSYAALLVQRASSMKHAFGIMLGGEAATWSLVKLLRLAGVARVWNEYGPTECTVAVSNELANVERQQAEFACVGIGRPGKGSWIGVIRGAGWIGGAQVTQGYLEQVQQTRAAFRYDFGYNDGRSKMYESGDQMQAMLDGKLMYEGRLDDQVKISGQRVELGAVENAVLACAGVQQCAVVVVEASGAMKSLAAVFVGSASEGEVKSELARRVARHEVPSVVVRVEGIPLTTAGKADRRAVRAMVAGRGAGGAAATGAARREEKTGGEEEATSVESVVREAFGEVLGRMKVDGWKGSFWELGGTSLMAMALDAALQRKTGVKVGIGRLMRDGSVAGIAETIKGEWRETAMGGAARLLEERAAEKQQERQQQQETRSPLFWASASQAGLYVAWKMEESPKNAYTVSQVFEAEERLDEGRLARAVAGLRRVHETLRTRFCEADGRVMQVVEAEEASGGGAGLEVVEAEDRVEQELVARELARHAFDLRQGPLLRVVLVRCAPAAAAAAAAESCKDVLVFVMPHICYDHGSEKRLFGDLVKLYKEEKTAKELRGTSMREFVAWEERVLAERGPVLEAYWKRALGGAKLNRIPGTKSCGAREEAARVESIRWKAEAGERVRGWMRKHGWHQVSVLHATMAALIARLSGDESVVLAIALSQRGGVASGDEVVGYLMNTVWVRYEVRMEQMGLVEYVDECQRRISEAFEHGEYPLALVWRAAGFGEMGAGDEVTVALDVVPRFPAEEVSGLLRESGIERPQLPPQMIQFSGELEGATTAGLAVNARAGNFSESSCGAWSLLAKWNSLFLNFVSGFVAEANFEVRSLEEVANWNRSFGCGVESVQALLISSVRSRCFRLLRLPFFELCFALMMRRSRVQVLVEFSLVAEGKQFALIDAELPRLLADKRVASSKAEIILVDADFCNVEGSCVAMFLKPVEWSNADRHVSAEESCYSIFTSGSTGDAKEILATHRCVRSFLNWNKNCSFGWCALDSFLFASSIAFDTSLTMMFWPLICGGSVFVHEESFGVAEIRNCISYFKVSAIFFTPTQLDLIATSGASRSIRLVISIGEQFSCDVLRRVSVSFEVACVWNAYGPTETTNFVSLFETSKDRNRIRGDSVPIGKALDQSWFSVCWNGHIRVHGPQVSSGYRLVSQTKRCFLYDVLRNDGKSRSFETGDICSEIDGGDLLFLGRQDEQVKVSGRRVELGSVRNSILSCTGVEACAVVVGSANCVAAFVVLKAGHELEELRSCLRLKLADYEYPRPILSLPQLPMTPSGKIDLVALKKRLSGLRVETDEVPVDESAASEVKACMEKVLGLDFVGLDESFWDIGGSSLHGIALCEEVWRACKIRLTLSSLLRLHATPRELVRVQQEEQNANKAIGSFKSGHLALRRFGGDGNGVVVFVSGFGLLAETGLPIVSSFREFFEEIVVLEFAGVVESVDKIARRGFSMLTLKEKDDIRVMCGYSAGGLWIYEMMQLLNRPVDCWLIDCHFPPFLQSSSIEIMRFVMGAVVKLGNASEISSVPDQYLAAVFVDLLVSVVGLCEADARNLVASYVGDEMMKMLRLANDWKPKGSSLEGRCLLVTSCEADDNLCDLWAPLFANDLSVFASTEKHNDMLWDAARIIKEENWAVWK